VLPEHDVDYGVVVPVGDLRVDPQAQRTLNEKRAQGIAANLVKEAVGSIVVSQRSTGEKFIVDGMHRRRACELAGLPTMTCEIHHGLTQQEEAILFLIKNRESNKPNALDEYNVGLTARLPLFVDTDAVLKSHGLGLGSSSTNSVGAVAGVLRITDTFGPEILDRTLSVAEEAWGRNKDAWDGVLLGGLSTFLGRHGDAANDSELARKIGKKPAFHWVRDVHSLASSGGIHNTGTGSRVTTCYQLMLREWNKGRRKNLIAA